MKEASRNSFYQCADSFKFVLVSVICFCFVAHGASIFGFNFSHDSLMIFATDQNWQISLGRIFQPYYLKIRGELNSPLLIWSISIINFSLSVFFLSRVFEIKNRIAVVLLSGLVVTSYPFTLIAATYINWLDIFSLALLFSVFSVFMFYRGRLFTSVLSIVASLGLYQAFFQVVVLLFCLMLLQRISLGRVTVKELFVEIIKIGIVFGLSALCYWLSVKLMLVYHKISMANSYNGLAQMGFSGMGDMLKNVVLTYEHTFSKLCQPQTYFFRFSRRVTVFLLVLFSIMAFFKTYKRNASKWLLVFVLLIIAFIPFGMNLNYFLSKGMEHHLMMFSFVLILVASLIYYDDFSKFCIFKISGGHVVFVIFSVLLFSNIVFSNHVYQKKELEDKATLSAITRVLDRIESIPSYKPGVTPVVFIGEIANSAVTKYRAGFDRLYDSTGLGGKLSPTYNIYLYIDQLLGYPIKKGNANAIPKEEIEKLGVFPAQNSCSLIKGNVVVRFQ